MVKISRILCVVLTMAHFFQAQAGLHDAVIIDTVDREPLLYKPFIDSLTALNYNVTYKPLDLVIDQSIARLGLARYKAAFFVFGSEFLTAMGKSHVCTKVLQALAQYAQLPGVLIGFILPPLRSDPHLNIVNVCAPLFNMLGIKTPLGMLPIRERGVDSCSPHENTQHMINDFFVAANTFLATPLETRPMMYHTTLNIPHAGIQFDLESIQESVNHNCQPLYLLPLNTTSSAVVRPTLPYGLYWFNPVRKNHIFIATQSIVSFSSISENFQICPIDTVIRNEMLMLMHRMMWELSALSRMHDHKEIMSTARVIQSAPAALAPPSFMHFGRHKKKYGGTMARKIAWMEINVFQAPTDDELAKDPDLKQQRAEQQRRLVDYIFDGGIDGLWISFNPQMYHSPIGRLTRDAEKKKFYAMIARFTQRLHDVAQTRHMPLPEILVGYEITNNIYEPNLPAIYAVDIYENLYKDLPAPLHHLFWEREVIKPLEDFVRMWRRPEISHGVPLGGVVLDLEMYCRKKTGSFSSVMGFDAYSFKKFIASEKLGQGSTALRDRPLLLMQKRLGARYFNFLEREAVGIGVAMQKAFMRLVPRCQIMCYMPNVHVSWFYTGLCKGLSAGQRPIHLLTFNSEFLAHKHWFEKKNITASHATVLLLSKLADHHDFSLVDRLLARHDGLWLNRFSRFVEPPARDWTSVEQPRIPEQMYSSFMEYINER